MRRYMKAATALTFLAGSVVAPTGVALASGGTYLTAYVGWGDPGALAAASAAMGHPFTYASDYVSYTSWTAMDNPYDERPWQGTGYTMIWGVPMLTQSGGTLAAGASGQYNKYFRVLAQHLVADGQGHSVLRLGWEFNSNSFPWYAAGQPTAFVAYWKQIVNTMRSVPGQNFMFEWNPDRGDNGQGDMAMGNFDSYYPGSTYVDVIGLDVYDQSWGVYPGATQEFTQIEDQTWGLNWLAEFGESEGKPIAIPELGLGAGGYSSTPGGAFTGTGSVSGGDDGTFIADISGWVTEHPVVSIAYWDHGSGSVQNGNDPLVLQALKAGF